MSSPQILYIADYQPPRPPVGYEEERSSSTSTIRARARGIEETFEAVFDKPMHKGHWRLLEPYISQGMEAEVIEAAMAETMLAPVPSMRYTCAILTRCIRSGITTMELWQQDQQAHVAKKPVQPQKPHKQVIEQMYGQRETVSLRYADYYRPEDRSDGYRAMEARCKDAEKQATAGKAGSVCVLWEGLSPEVLRQCAAYE